MDQHYSYKPDTIAWVIHEQLPHLCVVDVERLAEAIDELRPEPEDLEPECDGMCGWMCGYDDGRDAGIADAIAALEAL